MRKKLLFLVLMATILGSFAQNLRKAVEGEAGVSKHFTALTADQQKSFSPADAKALLNLDANSDLVLYQTEPDKLGYTHYRYYQTYRGIPIENSMYIIHTKNGKVTGMSGEIILTFDAQMSSRMASGAITTEGAKTTAINFVNAKKYAWEDAELEARLKEFKKDPTATYQPKPTLVWYSNDDNLTPKNLQLAYKVEIYAKEPVSKAFYFVDAKTGAVLGKKDQLFHTDATGTANTLYSGTQTIHSDLVSGVYNLRDISRGNGIVTRNANASGTPIFTNTSANWSLSTPNRNALDIHYGFEMTYDYYKNKFGRNSLDNAGLLITGYANDPSTTDNAYWDGSAMWFGTRSGTSNGVTGIDVIGHELTHGVTQYTCNLNYSNEPGAMNESLSDIMGKSVQFVAKPTDINWLLSNDMGWYIRSFSNPNAYSQPDTYKGTNWYSGTSDNGGVHYNSGVGNFMFYLLVNGGSGTNDLGNAYSVTGVGLDKADQIIYRSQTVYLVSTSKYADWRTACINAATDLYGASSAEVTAVQNAFYAVGIGTAGGSTSCGTPTGLAAASITTTGATVSWTAVSGATSYTLQYKTSAATTWTTVSGITATSKALTGLTAGTTYNYQVSATCSSGTSAYSTASSFTTTIATSCGTPTGLAAASITTTGATVSWTAVSGATSYTLQYKTSAATTWTTVSGITTTSKALTGLTAGTTYNYQVSATCSGGTSAYSTASSFTTTTATSCGTPTGLAAASITTTGATVSWTAVSGATSYTLQYKTSAATTWTTVSGITTTSKALTGLTAGTTYNYQVSATCSGGTSAYSTASSFTTTSNTTTTYCSASGTSQSYEWIDLINLKSINRTSGKETGGYVNTGLSTNLVIGSTNDTIRFSAGFTSTIYTEYWRIYIDFNKNGVFTDAGETVVSGSATGSGTYYAVFSVPSTATTGATRMRVVMSDASSATSCGTFSYGEVEDYTINLTTGFNAENNGIPSENSGMVFNADSKTIGASETVVTKKSVPVTNNTLTVYPNPVNNGNAVLSFNLNTAGNLRLRIVDMTGRVLKENTLGFFNEGENTYPLTDFSDISAGSYLLFLEQDGKTISSNRISVIK